MYKPISEKFVKQSIIKWLFRHGWGKNLETGELKDKGVDIKVRHNNYGRYFLIEVKGEGVSKSWRSQNEVNFVYGLGQLITRMKTTARYYYGLALPESMAKTAIRRVPWQVAKKLSLFIFSIDKIGKVKRYSGKELQNIQT